MNRRALVVDDDEGVRFVLREALRRGGWTVTELNDGACVEEAVEREAYDLILLDLFMPGMNGYEVLRRLRQRPAGMLPPWKTPPSVRVIILSGGADHDGFAFARRIGADACLPKPVDLQTLMAAVRA